MSLLIAFGTRPEWIKVKPVIDAIGGIIDYRLLYVGQHTDLIDSSVHEYGYKTLPVKDNGKNRLDSIVCSVMGGIDQHLDGITHVMVQGDTTTVLAVALACFHRRIKVIHLEAGLRTEFRDGPYPEEFNRRAVGALASLHLCPSENEYFNLQHEGILRGSAKAATVGNTVLDNLYGQKPEGEKYILVTMHRRENQDKMEQWIEAINDIAKDYDQYEWVWPVHPNMKHLKSKIKFGACDPMPHKDIIKIIKNSKIIITDSGGIIEEASFFKKQTLVCRQGSERHCLSAKQVYWIDELREKFESYIDDPVKGDCPWGDGQSAKKILEVLMEMKW
jgi:UDP-N-acetylglucosamine 2-epimerase (non-hydrolysing)